MNDTSVERVKAVSCRLLFFVDRSDGIPPALLRILDAIWAWRYDGVLPDEFQEAILG